MPGARKTLPAEDGTDQATLEFTQADLLSFLDGVNARVPLRENEITVDQLAERRGLTRGKARKMLAEQVKLGTMIRREANYAGKFCWAYSLVKK